MSEPTAAAVLVPIEWPVSGGPPRIGFVTRSTDSTTHPGHVGFPGGKAEPGDADLIETARRETLEETALGPPDFSIHERIDDHHTRSTGFSVAPIPGTIHHPERFLPDSREVTDAFWATVSDLRNAYEMDGDRVRFRLNEGDVWGVTGRIVASILVSGYFNRYE